MRQRRSERSASSAAFTDATDALDSSDGAPASEASRRKRLPVASAHDIAAELRGRLRGHEARLLGVLLLFLGQAAAGLVFPLVIGALVDLILGSGQSPRSPSAVLWPAAALLGVAALGSGVLAWLAGRTLARFAETIIAELRERYVRAALKLPRSVIERAGTGDAVTRASDDITTVSASLPAALPRVCVSVFTIALVALGLGGIDLRFLIAFALALPLYAVALSWYLRAAPPVYAAERAAQSARGEAVLHTLTQLPSVRAFGLAERQLARIGTAGWTHVRWAMRARIVQNRLFARLNLAEAVGLSACLGIGVWLAVRGEGTPGDVTAAALLFLRVVAPIEALLAVLDDLQSAFAALGRVVGVIAAAPSVAFDADTATERHPERDSNAGSLGLELRGVGYSYRPDVPVLSGVSFAVPVGTVLAVVGATGSGKSTLAALIAGIYQPSAGRIVAAAPQHRIVTVTQETHVFSGTLRENLSLAAPGVSDTELLEALSGVGAAELPGLLPEGLDSRLGAGGHPLSAAQSQILALARALLSDPTLVILDEATAAADSADGAQLDQAVASVVSGRTAIIIAHRLTQTRLADRIAVLERGRLQAFGTHEELLHARGRYAALWDASGVDPG